MSIPVGAPITRWPPQPPEPPDQPLPRSPWLPEARPPAPASASASLVIGAPDWLAQRLLEQRVIAVAGELDEETVNRIVAELGLLDATGDDPVSLRLSGVSADLGAALTLVDALDLMGAPVHVTCLGTLTGPAVAVLAVGDRRIAGRHTTLHLCEPRTAPGHAIPGRDLEIAVAERARQLGRLQERLAAACGRPVDGIAADMRAGRLLTAEEAQEYGLLDATEPTARPPVGPVP
ncbi:ATP-dependent Clp protease proteolytic subunit [Blastococcus sp. CT_GayMR16]|uniref:ATP-dependent Clp protease proteolytic subunit n=1 Tax=Blastococcus sp. CT_GayMR16 TaxID=2559607 RepID=UPI00107320D5|nr:ATP-dependent Clp protease proteolytic subunit [Blastococcus sp. CT_GayMR16]TFV87911.1 ATP-dependent Clp protease proteolytic subunit [Blastococcus sp. CT_GayMR16]